MIKWKKGSILEADEIYIAHQCNCVSENSVGLALNIFNRFPQANTYGSKRNFGTIDTIHVGNGKYIINMYAQYYPGGPKYKDTSKVRLEAFQSCLDYISEIPLSSIAMPDKIGCGLAKGDWDTYYKMIEQFSKKHSIDVILYQI